MNAAPDEAWSENWIAIPPEALSETSLHNLLIEFATRDGTDYGEHEVSLDVKIKQLRHQVLQQQVLILYHLPSEQITLARREQLAREIIELLEQRS
jgi:hypothetical protein